MLLRYFIHFIYTLSLDQMKIHNSVAKQKLLTEKVYGSQFQFAGIYYYQQYTKPFNSEIK